MTAIEDPAAQLNNEAASPDHRPAHELEGWLSDLRTDVAADPPGWITKEPAGEPPAAQEPPPVPGPPPGQSTPPAAEPRSGGRHRAPE